MGGKAKNILNSYKILNMKETEDDQALFTELMLKRPDLVIMDYEQKLIGNNAWTEWMDVYSTGMRRRKNLSIQLLKHFRPFFIFKVNFMNAMENSQGISVSKATCAVNWSKPQQETTTIQQANPAARL